MSDTREQSLHHIEVHPEALKHFELRRDPFSWLPEKPVDFFYSTDMARIEITCHRALEGPRMAAIIGEVGSGKSSAVRHFIEKNLANKQGFAYSILSAPQMRQLEMRHIMQKALHDFTRDMRVGYGIIRTAEAMCDALEDMAEREIQPILFVEDAHLLGIEPLRELKLLHELRRRIRPILAIVLIGQPELSKKLRRHDLRQFTQRSFILKLDGLKNDMEQYLKHRFNRRNSRQALDLFDRESIKELQAHPGINTPLEVNIICARVLNFAWQQGAERVDRELMFEVLSTRDDVSASPAPVEEAPKATGQQKRTAAA